MSRVRILPAAPPSELLISLWVRFIFSRGEMTMEKTTLYFEKTGPENTGILLSAAKIRAEELGIRDIVVATSHGGTAVKAREAFGPGANIVAVTISEGFKDKGWAITESERKALEDRGIRVLTSIHALGGDVGSAFTAKYGGGYPVRAVRDTLYRFGQGMKVAVNLVDILVGTPRDSDFIRQLYHNL